MTNAITDDVHHSADECRAHRIWVAGAFGAMFAGSELILDFWPVGVRSSIQTLRVIFDLSRVLLLLPIAGFIFGLLIAASVALWNRHFRRMASSIFAIVAIPVCIVVIAKVPLFDPWLWYAIANKSRFEALAASGLPSNGMKYALVERQDVSTGLAGLNPAHFVMLIYDDSDAVGLDPSERPSNWHAKSP